MISLEERRFLEELFRENIELIRPHAEEIRLKVSKLGIKPDEAKRGEMFIVAAQVLEE